MAHLNIFLNLEVLIASVDPLAHLLHNDVSVASIDKRSRLEVELAFCSCQFRVGWQYQVSTGRNYIHESQSGESVLILRVHGFQPLRLLFGSGIQLCLFLLAQFTQGTGFRHRWSTQPGM